MTKLYLSHKLVYGQISSIYKKNMLTITIRKWLRIYFLLKYDSITDSVPVCHTP